MQVQGHDHVCAVIEDRATLLEALRRFLTGLGAREGVFIHRYSEQEAWTLLETAGPARELQRTGLLAVVGREAAFQGDAPRIHPDHVAATVGAAFKSAKSNGRGLAILADASAAYIEEGRAKEWFAFESWLGRKLDQDIILTCLYWRKDLEDATVLDGMMRTHLARLSAGPTS